MATATDTTERQAATREIGRAVKHSLVYGIGGIAQKAVAFLMLPFYTRYLLPRDYGVLEILNLAMSLLGMFLAMGIPAGLMRYYASMDSEEERRRLVGTAAFCVAATGVTIFAAVWLTIRPASHLLLGPNVPTKYLLLMLAYFTLSYIASVPVAYIRAKEASLAIMTVETSALVVTLALTIYLVGMQKEAVYGVLISQLTVNSILVPGLLIWMYRQVGFQLDRVLLRKVVSFGAPLVLANLAMFGLNFSDRIFLQRFRSLDVVGVYGVGYKFGYMINFLLVQPFNAMWMVRMYQIQRSDNYRHIFRQVFILYSVALVFVGLTLSLFGAEAVHVMTDSRYAAAGQVIPPVVLAYIFLGIGLYLQLGMFLASRTAQVGIVSLIAAGLNLALNYVLIDRFGMMGAAWATTIGFLAIAVGSYFYSQRIYPLDLGLGRVLKLLLAAAFFYGLSVTLRVHSEWLLVWIKICLLSGFTVALPVMKVLNKEDLITILSLARTVGVALIKATPVLRHGQEAREIV